MKRSIDEMLSTLSDVVRHVGAEYAPRIVILAGGYTEAHYDCFDVHERGNSPREAVAFMIEGVAWFCKRCDCETCPGVLRILAGEA